MLVTPKTPVHRSNEDFAGWWRIDPQSGDSLGIAENGWGQDMDEEDVTIAAVLRFGRAFMWENGMCHVFSQAVNSVIVIKELLVGDWHPSWTGLSYSIERSRSGLSGQQKDVSYPGNRRWICGHPTAPSNYVEKQPKLRR